MKDDDALGQNPHVSRRALEAIHSQLYGWALTRCGFDRSAAEDLMQEAYVAVLSGAARFDNKSSLKTFLFSVVQNLARSRFRQIALRMRLLTSYAAGAEDQGMDGAQMEGRKDRQVWKAVESLPARQRDVTELVFCRDMTIEEAAAVMGVSVGTGRVHYDRAKKALAEKLSALRDTEF
jgi:RNA polymerase sigma-70 factor (ECF subfamily)